MSASPGGVASPNRSPLRAPSIAAAWGPRSTVPSPGLAADVLPSRLKMTNAALRRLAVVAVALATSLTAGTAPLRDASIFTSEKETFRVVILVEGLEHPWSLAFLPDGDLLITERPGRLRIVHAGKLDPQPVQEVPAVVAYGQGGLLDVALHPQYATNGWLYLSYVAGGEGGIGTDVVRGHLRDHRLEDVQVIFRMQPKTGKDHHFGSRLLFDREGYLYVTLGERGERDHAQRLDDHLGKIVRLHDDGRVPKDNPFRGRPGARSEIFTYGHRNVQGIALHPATGVIWAHEHGPQGGDEVNVIRGGTNYGWPVITYGREYDTGSPIGEGTHKAGLAQPIHFWVPLSIAPSGMAFYDGDRFPHWRGDLFIGALRGQMLVRLELQGEKVVREERLLRRVLGRIRDVRIGPDGLLYLLTDSSRGILARLEPISP
jgi:aldose sugar dehydrogenase